MPKRLQADSHRGGLREHVPVVFALVVCVSTLCSCASIVNGSYQAIQIHSQPANATVTFNGQVKGVTPLILDLSRSKRGVGVIEISKPGYETQRYETRQRVSGAFWGNLGFLLVGGLPLMLIDGIAGTWANIYPSRLTAVRLDPIVTVEDEKSGKRSGLQGSPGSMTQTAL
jgi:hypothetical protein